MSPKIDLEALKGLDNFIGTEDHHKYQFGVFLTDGAKFLAENAQAYWLMDVIASYQFEPKIARNPRLRQFQLWMLNVGDSHEFIKPSKGNKAVVTCWEDTPKIGVKPAVKQQISHTDFPLPEIKLWLQNKIIMLPSEN